MASDKYLTTNKPTTLFRECLGLFGAFAWFFCSMYSYEDTLFESYVYIPAFLLALFLSMLGFGLYFKRDIHKLSRFAKILTPCGVVCTAVMALLPLPGFIALYIASGAFIGPVILRRVYGAVELGGEKRRFRCYFQAVALTVIFHSVWAILPIGHEIKFPVIALLAAVAWFGSWREAPEPEYIELPKQPKGAAVKQTVLVALAALLWVATDYLIAAVHTYFVLSGFEGDLMLWFGGTILPAIGFFLFAHLFDRQRERGAFLFGMGFALLGMILALIPNGGLLTVPLLFTDGLGATFTEFILVAASVYLYRNSRRPFLAAAGGLLLTVLFCATEWCGGLLFGFLLPNGENTDPNMVLWFIGPAAVATLAFIALGLYLMERQKEKNIVYALFKQFRPRPALPEAAAPALATPTGEAMLESGFTQPEREIALLLMEGDTQRDIARKLHMSAADVSGQLKAIKQKVSGKTQSDPVLAAIAKEYKLTRRETDMLSGLRRGMTNAEIAAELVLAEETVRIHVRNLMKKLPVENRQDVISWAEAFADTTVPPVRNLETESEIG